jgi:DNA polymerase-1
VRRKLEAGKELALLSLGLAEICTSAPVDADPAHYARRPVNHPEAYRLLAKLEMFSAIERWGISAEGATLPASEQAPSQPPWKLLTNAGEAVENLVETAEKLDITVVFHGDEPVEYAFCCADCLYVFNREAEHFDSLLHRLLASATVKRVESSKQIWRYAYKNNLIIQNVNFDLELAAYLLSPNASDYSVERLCAEYAATPAPLQESAPESARHAAGLHALCDLLGAKIEENGQQRLLEEIELPLARVLASMEADGFAIDTGATRAFGEQLDGEIAVLQQRIYNTPGRRSTSSRPSSWGWCF